MKESLCLEVLRAGALDIRKVPKRLTNEEVAGLPLENQPFFYSSKNWGPGYADIKGLVGRKKLMGDLVFELAKIVSLSRKRINFVAGNVSGGMIPGWVLSEILEFIWDMRRPLPFVYIREGEKEKGHKELITGISNNPEITPGSKAIIFEELVNFANTTCRAATLLKDADYIAEQAATILFYENPEAVEKLERRGIKMIHLFTMNDLLDVATKFKLFPSEAINDYRDFLSDPASWQAERGLTPL